MNIVLFCENRYAIDILLPLYEEAMCQGRHSVLWYIHARIDVYTLPEDARRTDCMQDVYDFDPDAIYVPGNIVPYYLPGCKIQVFHGYAAEKGDQFRIRGYFDLYLTQGPFFTKVFKRLANKHKDFEVVETGWTKQDWIRIHIHDYDAEKESLLGKYCKKRVVLYAPTFSPRLTSLPYMILPLERLLEREGDVLLLVKLHPLANRQWADRYREWGGQRNDVVYMDQAENITKCQLMSDVMVSDTSSAVYEFLLLGRPVITVRSVAKEVYWENITDENILQDAYCRVMDGSGGNDGQQWVMNNYDPHSDGHCCERMIEAAENWLRRNGKPRNRRLNLWRKYTSIKTFGRIRK